MQSGFYDPGIGGLRVSCTSASACTAVATYGADSDGDPAAFSAHWNGVRWTFLRGASGFLSGPSGYGALADVSCGSLTACVAVGYGTPGVEVEGASTALAQRWNGTRWLTQNAADQTAPASTSLSGVACATPSACTAVGHYINGLGQSQPVAERWGGTDWTLQSTPALPSCATGTMCQLTAVSCPTASMCVAVGGESYGPLVEVWSGGSWTIQTIPTQPGSDVGALTGVSCASPIACIGVGSSGLVARFDGSGWSVQDATEPPGGTVGFNAVSCTSSDACTAAGVFTSAGPAPFVTQPLVERWDGSNWTIENTPSPANSGAFTGISCASAEACTAVGNALCCVLPSSAPVAESWDGSNWTVENIPDPSTGQNSLGGVSCASATACTAVGFFALSPKQSQEPDPGVEVWDGATWTVQSVPTPSEPSTGPAEGGLSGVSCPSLDVCVAVGTAANGPLAEVYS